MTEQGQETQETADNKMKKKIKKMFCIFDKDKNGTIDATELGNVMRAIGQNPTADDIQKMIKLVDKNDNGVIEYSEFEAEMVKHMKQKNPDEELREAFRFFDPTGEGFIDRAKLSAALAKLGDLDHADVDAMLDKADRNKDGRIDYNEFVAVINRW